MTKKKNILPIILIIVLLGLVAFASQRFALFGETVLLPQFGHIYCGERIDSPVKMRASVPDDQETIFFYCGPPTIRGYTAKGCDFQWRRTDWKVGGKLGVCQSNGICDFPLPSKPDTNVWYGPWHTDMGGYLALEPQQTLLGVDIYDEGDWQIYIESPVYGLWHQELGHLIVTTSCDIKSLGLGYDQLTEDKKAMQNNLIIGTTILKVGPITNFIVGSIAITDPINVITHNGKLIYITQPGCYYEIKESDKGLKYADTRVCIPDSSIVCVPSQPYCAEDASRIVTTPEGKPCSELAGMIENYIQISSIEACKYKCVDGKLFETDDCIAIPEECPPEKPLWDSQKGECVGIGPITPPASPFEDPTLKWVLIGAGIIFLFLLVMLLIKPPKPIQ